MVSRSRRSSVQPLAIWMNGERVGVWGRTAAGVETFQYHDDWLVSQKRRPISLTLPFLPGNGTHTGADVSSWFENLLPDSADIRNRIARRFKVKPNTRSLLAEIGRDCVGAVQILPLDKPSSGIATFHATPLTDEDVARTIRGVTSTLIMGQTDELNDFRISLAGAQEKTALLRKNDEWFRPDGATPSTHILKLPLGLVGSMRYDLAHSVENEWLCMQLLQALGFEVANTSMGSFADDVSTERVLVVERFDREWTADGSQLIRLPQEDFCQATGTPPENKYESDGGPGIRTSLELLRTGLAPEEDVRTFILCQLAFWLLAAVDGHAKNFSLFLNRDGHMMTPLYDVISAWPFIGIGPDKLAIQKVKLAMALRGKSAHRELDRIQTRHWRTLADHSGVQDSFSAMEDLVERVPHAIEAVAEMLPKEFPPKVWDSITKGMKRQAGRFLAGKAGLIT